MKDSASKPFTFGSSLKPIPCAADKLLPPLELMTRERSFRHLYWKYHPPATKIRKMDFLQKHEDPAIVKKRDEIFARIRAAELSSERIKREKEARQKERMAAISESLSLPPSNSEYSGNDDSQDGSLSGNNSTENESVPRLNQEPHGIINSGFVTDARKTQISSSVSSVNSSFDETNDDDEVFGDSFSFLADWKKESSSQGRKKKIKL